MEALRALEERLSEEVSRILAESFPKAFLVEARLRVHRPEPEVFIRVDTDAGITLDQCVQIHLLLREKLLRSDWLPENCSLSVSSPGVEAPLKFARQYPRNIGRLLAVRLQDRRQLRGILRGVDEAEGITLQVGPRLQKIRWEEIAVARVELPRRRRPSRPSSRRYGS